jgi:hypothetical protein
MEPILNSYILFKTDKILKWLDQILADAINASPYTTPARSRNATLFSYEAALQHYHFSAGLTGEEMVALPPVNIFLKGNREYQQVGKVRYNGRELLILEHETDAEDADEGD